MESVCGPHGEQPRRCVGHGRDGYRRCGGAGDGHVLGACRELDSGLDGTRHVSADDDAHAGPITVSPGDEGGPLTNAATHTGAITQGDVDVLDVYGGRRASQSRSILVETSEPTTTGHGSGSGVPLGVPWATFRLRCSRHHVASAPVTGTYLVSSRVSTLSRWPGTVRAYRDISHGRPVANAGADQSVNPGSTVQLSGAGSTDPDSDSLTYVWSLTSRPSGSNAALSSPSAIAPTSWPTSQHIRHLARRKRRDGEQRARSRRNTH